MSEFDLFSSDDDALFHVIKSSPQTTSDVTNTITPSSASSSTIPQSNPSSAVAPSSATTERVPPFPDTSPDQSSTTPVVVVLRQKRTSGTGSGVRGSFYASGTMSARGSRDTSPVRFVPQKRATPYPVPPPSMIINPSKTPMRATAADRGGRVFDQGEVELLCEKLRNVGKDVSKEDLNSNEVKVETQTEVSRLEDSRSLLTSNVELDVVPLEKGGVVEYAPLETAGFIRSSDFYHSLNRTKLDRVDRKVKSEKRSVSVSPRTARKKFFDQYPYDPPPQKEKWQPWRRNNQNNTVNVKEVSDEMKDEVVGKVVGDQGDSATSMVQDSGIPRRVETRSRRIGLLNFSTLPFFRKKSPGRSSDQLQKTLSQGEEPPRERPASAMASSAEAAKSSAGTRSRLHFPKFSTNSSRNSASPTRSPPLPETRDQGCHSAASAGPGYILSGQTSLPRSKGLRREVRETQGHCEVRYTKETQVLKEPKEIKHSKETKEPRKSQEPKKSNEQRRSLGPKESFEPVKSKLESKFSDPGLQTTTTQQASSQSLYEDGDQHSNSLKFQRIMKPFRKLGMGGGVGSGGVGSGSGLVAGGSGGSGGGNRSSKPNDRLSFPTFQTLSESTMRSISLSSDLLKELNAGYGQLKVTPRTRSEDETEEEDEEGFISKSVSATYANKMASDEPVSYRSLDRKKKTSYF